MQHHQIFALSQTKRKSLKYRDRSSLKSLQKKQKKFSFSDSGTNLLKNCKPKHVSLSSWPQNSPHKVPSVAADSEVPLIPTGCCNHERR